MEEPMVMIDESITIDRPAQDVWEFVRDPTNQTLWQSSLIEFEADWEDRAKVGDHARGVTKVAGKKIAWESEVTQVDPAKSFAFKTVDGPFPMEFRYTYEPEDGGTRFRIRGETPGTGGFFGKLGDGMVARMYARNVRSDLENLKALLEAGD
jgi:uncharacterized membrane protein